MRLGIISDTHNMLREEVITKLKTCDYILHAGDFCKSEVLKQLEEIRPVYSVKGNNDKGEWAEGLPVILVVALEGHKICIVHDKKDIPENLNKVEMVVYGHSHKYESYHKEGIWYINPGSCGKKRFSLPLSFVIVTISEEEKHLEKIDL